MGNGTPLLFNPFVLDTPNQPSSAARKRLFSGLRPSPYSIFSSEIPMVWNEDGNQMTPIPDPGIGDL